MNSRMLRSIAPVIVAFATVSLFPTASLHAQATTSLVTTRLTQPIDENALVTLKGTVHPLANVHNDRGAAPDSMPLDRIQVVLQRSLAQEAALQQLIHDEHTPGTANYHKWLTPTQFGQQFGPSDQDVATIEAWLASKGFNVGKVDPGKQILEISGSVAQFRTAFHTQIHKYMVNGETHYANSTNPQIPAALAPVFGGFASLNNFKLKSYAHKLGLATYNVKTNQATPQWTYGTSSGESFVLAPSDFAVQYDLPPSITGAGQTIAIINDSNINVALVNQFRSLFGLPANPPQVIIDGNDPGVDGINNPDGPNGHSDEAYLDVEWSGAVAPNATVDLVIAADTALEQGVFLAAEHAVYSNVAPVLSLSFGACEQEIGSENAYFNDLWEQAAAQGITVTVSTGDSGSAGCDDPDTQYYAVNGLAVSGWASTPYNVAVGGTDFYYSDYATGAASIANYWNTSTSQSPMTSIKGVIPEQPWNDSQYGLDAVDFYTTYGGSVATTIAGGSGGASVEYSKPAWQTTLTPSDSARDIPDVSLFAADGLNYTYYPICYSDGDCQTPSGSNLVQITAVGGTSAAAPSFAGIMALVNQEYGRQGQADYVLYPLAKQFPAAFHDVTAGTNAEPCAVTTANCNSVTSPITVTDPNLGTATEGELSGYAATTGYNRATGLGSVDASVLINDWGSVKFASTTVSLTSPTTGTSDTHGSPVTFTGTVTGTGNSTPAGNIAIETDSTEPGQQGQGFPGLFNNVTVSTLALNSSGDFSGSISTLPGGTYNVWANYGGDGTNASAASEKAQITISPEASTTDFSIKNVATGSGYGSVISSGATNIPYGTQLILSAQPVPTTYYTTCIAPSTPPASCNTASFTSPTGTVTFADNNSTINTAVLNAEGDAEYNAPWPIGSHSVTASYNGDNSYNKSTASAITFSIAKDTPEINLGTTIATQAGALVGGQQDVLTVQVLNSANLGGENTFGINYSAPVAAPTGTVTISGFPSGVPTTATLAPGVDQSSFSAAGIATITIPAGTAAGNYNVTVTYPGDTNYASQTTTATIPIQSVGGVATTTTANLTGSISPTTSVTLSGTVTGKSGDAAPSNAGGGVLIYAAGYILQQISVVPGSGDTSTFSTVLNSRNLLQGTNPITVQYLGDNTYAPSAITLTPALSSPLSDFSMVPNTTIVPVAVGTPATDTIQLASVNGFANSVSFTCAAASGIICSLSPTSYGFTSGSSSTTTLTLDASSSAVNGANNVLITGTDSTGKYVHTLSINAEVTGATAPVAGFTLNASPSTLVLAPGASTTSPGISVTPSGGFTGAVALTAAVTSPSGATSPPTVTIGPATLNINGASAISSGLSIATTSTTTEGTYTITVTGESGSLIETATMTLTVSSSTFALSANSSSLTLSAGATTGNTSTITVAPSGGFTGSVALTCSVAGPSGANDPATCAVNPASVSVSGTASVTAILTVSTTAATSSTMDRPLNKFFAASGGIVVAALLFFGIPARRRSWGSIIAILLFAGIVGFGIGCGGGSGGGGGGGGGGGNSGTTSGTYTVTITGTSGSLAPTTTVTVIVN